MGAIYRSEEMCLAQIFLQNEAAYSCVAELGELGLVQFCDLNQNVSAFQRKYVNEVRRCDEMERKLRFLEKEIRKESILMMDSYEDHGAPQPREMFDLEETFEKLENELSEANRNEEMLSRNFNELIELKHVLRTTQQFFEENELEYQVSYSRTIDTAVIQHVGSNLISESDGQPKPRLNFVNGVIKRERLLVFERVLWRACYGKVFLRQAEISESIAEAATESRENKSVFIIFFQGDQLKTRVKKICEG
uniref:V-type proton ATPase subunit a n=1 Tax=Acrobeloides nanus TaxID=290746 RepID=A0A914CUR7_9BILA